MTSGSFFWVTIHKEKKTNKHNSFNCWKYICDYKKKTWSLLSHCCSDIYIAKQNFSHLAIIKTKFCHLFSWKSNICYQRTVVLFFCWLFFFFVDCSQTSRISHRSSLEPNLHLQRFNIPATNKRMLVLTSACLPLKQHNKSKQHTIKTESFLFTWMQLVHWWVKFWFKYLQHTGTETVFSSRIFHSI